MSKALVIYFSKYGLTKKYAEWIAGELSADIYKTNEVKKNILNDYDTIILGSGLYAGSIKGINLLVDNYELIKNRKIVIFTCGLADYSKTENINHIYKRLENVIPQNILENIKIFYLQGGINYKGLNILHKIMMGMLKIMTMKKGMDKISDEDKEFLETYGKTMDFTDKKNIKGIIEYCKN